MSELEVSGTQGSPRPGFTFKNGKLYEFSPRAILVIRSWPQPLSWRKKIGEDGWSVCRPIIPITNMRNSLRARLEPIADSLLPDRSHETSAPPRPSKLVPGPRAKAWHEFWLEVPEDLHRAVASYTSRHWQIFQLLSRCPGAEEIHATNPALTFMLASGEPILTMSEG